MKMWNKFLAWLRDDGLKLELDRQKIEIDSISTEPEIVASNGCTWNPVTSGKESIAEDDKIITYAVHRGEARAKADKYLNEKVIDPMNQDLAQKKPRKPRVKKSKDINET